MKISVNYGRRAGDQPLVLEVSSITDASEIYEKAQDATNSDEEASLVLEAVHLGKFKIVESLDFGFISTNNR